MQQIEIKDFKVNALPVIGVPNSRYYVPNGNGSYIDEYITDLNGNYRKVSTANSSKISATLGETIGSGFLVYLDSLGRAFKYNQNDVLLYDYAVGITNQSGVTGEIVDIIIGGENTQMGGLITSKQYYASNSGLLTDNITTLTGIIQPVGIATSATKLLVNIQKPYIKI